MARDQSSLPKSVSAYDVQRLAIKSLKNDFAVAANDIRATIQEEINNVFSDEGVEMGTRSFLFNLEATHKWMKFLIAGQYGEYERPAWLTPNGLDCVHEDYDLWEDYLQNENLLRWSDVDVNHKTMETLIEQHGAEVMQTKLEDFTKGLIKKNIQKCMCSVAYSMTNTPVKSPKFDA